VLFLFVVGSCNPYNCSCLPAPVTRAETGWAQARERGKGSDSVALFAAVAALQPPDAFAAHLDALAAAYARAGGAEAFLARAAVAAGEAAVQVTARWT